MIRRMKWTARTFDHELPIELFAAVLERLRGTPLRAAALLGEFAAPLRRTRVGEGWSAQEHVGHLDDLHELDILRLHEYLRGAAELSSADMTNRRTYEADHNATATALLLERFRVHRDELVRALEAVTEADAGRAAQHPRLRRPLRLIDWMYFVAEHDDHHLAAAREILRADT